MATTLSLNSEDSIMITTFWGGERGRCYTIHLFFGDQELVTTLEETEFFEMVLNYNDDIEVLRSRVKPEAVNTRVRTDPQLQRLLDEEEEIARRLGRPVRVSDLLADDIGKTAQAGAHKGELMRDNSGWFLMVGGHSYTLGRDELVLLV